MKHVGNADWVITTWLKQQQTEGRDNHKHIYFEGDTIYSYGYHFPMARVIHYCGALRVYITTRTYSVTTAKHKRYVYRASDYNALEVDNIAQPDLAGELQKRVDAIGEAIEKTLHLRNYSAIAQGLRIHYAIDRAAKFARQTDQIFTYSFDKAVLSAIRRRHWQMFQSAQRRRTAERLGA